MPRPRPTTTAPTAAAPVGWGAPGLRRATFTLAATQLVSWGVLFYGFAVVAPDVTADTGWSEPLVSGAFTLGLVVAGVAAPPVAAALTARDPRLVLTAGSLAGAVGMAGFALAPHPAVLYLAWAVVGLAMAATLYEPAMAVLVAIDPARRHRTLAAITVAGGLASTVFAPLGSALTEALGWRSALLVLGLGGGLVTAALHALALPPADVHPVDARAPVEDAPPFDHRLRALRVALLFEQAAILGTTAHLIGLLVDRGVGLGAAAVALGVMGVGKVLGRLALLGPVARRPPALLSSVVDGAQLVGLAVPLVVTAPAAVLPAMFVVGAGSGATTILRPLLVVDLVGPGPFAAVNARLQRTTTVARAAAPLALGGLVAVVGWSLGWLVMLAAFGVAAARYAALVPLTAPGRDAPEPPAPPVGSPGPAGR
ncbi:MAG TPA: MFS transporter [Acidimicrobiales bacterium]